MTTSIREQVLALLKPRGDELWFDDAAIGPLIAVVNKLTGPPLLDAAYELVRIAHFLDVEKRSRGAAATLLTVLAAIGPALQSADAARARALLEEADVTANRLADFSGDARVAKVLDTGARPAGTTPAGPMARFLVGKKPTT